VCNTKPIIKYIGSNPVGNRRPGVRKGGPIQTPSKSKCDFLKIIKV
jgi:hypothetical protein